MPELPEVETVVRDLRPLLVGQRITQVHATDAPLRLPWDHVWAESVAGSTITAIRRRAKWILLDLDTEARLVVHLGMTGQLTVTPTAEPLPPHTHFRFDLAEESRQLRYRDVRRFGCVLWFASDHAVSLFLKDRIGPEPTELDPLTFREAVRRTTRTLKAVLLDQTVIAGIGNIYADESLHLARLHPQRRGHALTDAECDRLRQAVVTVLESAIESRGSTIRDYVGGSGLKGNFQSEFRVYGRTGEACRTCRTPIEMRRIAGRSSHFCPTCQPVTVAK